MSTISRIIINNKWTCFCNSSVMQLDRNIGEQVCSIWFRILNSSVDCVLAIMSCQVG
jgi:hypothetical protein